ncbi:EF-hand domain-containing family member C2 [Symbiodinium microadriaticum]|uniref:EF-hand domain-containing family member C2 n=1 Tax=Symbiodinium microadriaticum TaxID=2951 RepID=A0A1Q9C6Z0_SYMMI|nr:EF-hand domain-containing family member C2 [Symbiodinium microadriaticum]
MATAGWRVAFAEPPPEEEVKEEDIIPKNMRYPRITPAWLKHEKQVLRFYGFFQESIPERWDENSRAKASSQQPRYFMEDGTIGINEPKVENSGIAQGTFLKRSRVLNEDGIPIGPDDMRVGQDLTLHGRTYHISGWDVSGICGCDRFTRWFFEENGIQLGEDEDVPTDLWQKGYRLAKAFDRGGVPLTRAAVEDKDRFLLNDRKVLRFKAAPWRSAQLSSLPQLRSSKMASGELSERVLVFMKRGPLRKSAFEARVVLWDCDDFTRSFYKEYLGALVRILRQLRKARGAQLVGAGIDQAQGRIDVAEKPLTHAKLMPPPHTGVGKVDLERMMKLTGEVLRSLGARSFECKMINGEPEDELRARDLSVLKWSCFMRLPAGSEADSVKVPVRNSGHMGGKFADKRRIKNPDTGLPFQLSDFYVGKVVTIAAQQITRADERCLQFLEARPKQFPYADPKACAKKLLPLDENPELLPDRVHPDRLKELAEEAGISMVDHEIVTLLRRFGRGVPGEKESDQPKIIGQACQKLRMEGKEVKEKDGDKQQEKNKAWLGIGFLMLSKQDDDVDDEIFGDDDDLAGYEDFEDGMGDDFEDAGAGGDGEGTY